MHIAEGILSAPVLGAGAALGAVGVGIGLMSMDHERTVKTAVLSSALFVSSLIHVPMGVGSVHLVLAGLAGLLLGWGVFPAMAVALLLQAIMFGHGGLTALGVNTVVMAFPGLVCYYLFSHPVTVWKGRGGFAAGFLAGALSIVLAAGLMALALMTTGREFAGVSAAVLVMHAPVAIIEGAVTGAVVSFLRKVRPETLHAVSQSMARAETPVA